MYKRLGLLPAVHHGVLAILMFASLLVVCTDALPASWALLRGMPAGSREALFSRVLELPLADVDRLVVDHTQYLGLHMRNTKYMAAEVLGYWSSCLQDDFLSCPLGSRCRVDAAGLQRR